MSHTHVGTWTGVLRVRATFDSDKPLSIMDAQDDLYGLAGFIYAGNLIAGAADRGLLNMADPLLYAQTLDDLAQEATRATQLERISYNSPLEVVLTVSSVAASLTLVGTALIGLWEKLENARTVAAGGKLQRSALATILQDLESRNVSTGDLRKRKHVDLLLEGAASAAGKLTNLEVEPDDS